MSGELGSGLPSSLSFSPASIWAQPCFKRGCGGWAGEWGFREWWVVGVGGVEELYVGLDGWCLWIEFHILPL